MSAAPLRLKQPGGWFAAGRQVACAVTLLTDSTFKLFVWLCLHADRSSGALPIIPGRLARALNKTDLDIRAGIDELVAKGVCRLIANDRIEVSDRFWPYERVCEDHASDSVRAYTDRIKRVFLDRRCVHSAFTAADEKLIAELYRKGVPVENVERAILLGSLRKYTALVNNGGGSPITSLHYFTGLFDEIEQVQVSGDYWRYIAYKVRQVERDWPLHGSDPKETK